MVLVVSVVEHSAEFLHREIVVMAASFSACWTPDATGVLSVSLWAVSEAKKAAENLRTASPYEATRIRAVRARLTNDLEAAEEAYQKLCDITPNSAEAFFDLASVQEEKGDLQEAFESLRRVIALDPKHPDSN